MASPDSMLKGAGPELDNFKHLVRIETSLNDHSLAQGKRRQECRLVPG